MGDTKDPCISICKFDDRICVGCGRSKDEIKGWKKMGKGEKREVLEVARERLKGLGKMKGKKR
jgi:predicted Fe-S protein YdhL (DUF1289 family)